MTTAAAAERSRCAESEQHLSADVVRACQQVAAEPDLNAAVACITRVTLELCRARVARFCREDSDGQCRPCATAVAEGREPEEAAGSEPTSTVRLSAALASGGESFGRLDVEVAPEHASYAQPRLVLFAAQAFALLHAHRRYEELEQVVVAEMAASVAREESISLVLDSMGDGLVVADALGALTTIVSKAARDWFGEPEPGAAVWEYLVPRDPSLRALLQLTFEEIVSDVLPFEVVAEQAPHRLLLGSATLALHYERVPRTGAVQQVLIRISDITARCAAEAADESARELVRAVSELLRDRSGFLGFLTETQRLLDQLGQAGELALQRRLLHTLKGNAAVFGLERFARECHVLEDWQQDSLALLAQAQLLGLQACWELSIGPVRSLLDTDLDGLRVTREEHDALLSALRELPGSEHVQKQVQRWRWEPARPRLERLGREAERLAAGLGKTVSIDIDCGDLRLPERQWKPLLGAFVHVVRNAVSHGIESAAARRAAGKPELGHVVLKCTRLPTGAYSLSCHDDGAGIDLDGIRRRALASGLPVERREDLIEALFSDGVSTAREVTAISGRGVGLGALRDSVRALGGEVSVESAPGQGTTFTCIVPSAVPPAGDTRMSFRTK